MILPSYNTNNFNDDNSIYKKRYLNINIPYDEEFNNLPYKVIYISLINEIKYTKNDKWGDFKKFGGYVNDKFIHSGVMNIPITEYNKIAMILNDNNMNQHYKNSIIRDFLKNQTIQFDGLDFTQIDKHDGQKVEVTSNYIELDVSFRNCDSKIFDDTELSNIYKIDTKNSIGPKSYENKEIFLLPNQYSINEYKNHQFVDDDEEYWNKCYRVTTLPFWSLIDENTETILYRTNINFYGRGTKIEKDNYHLVMLKENIFNLITELKILSSVFMIDYVEIIFDKEGPKIFYNNIRINSDIIKMYNVVPEQKALFVNQLDSKIIDLYRDYYSALNLDCNSILFIVNLKEVLTKVIASYGNTRVSMEDHDSSGNIYNEFMQNMEI